MSTMDADILDLCKENIQPLRQGRKANRLGLALQAQTDNDLKEQLDQEREQYELSIMTYEGDDPLQPRFDYVHWIEQSCPHRRESNLLPLLEDTIMLLKDNENYKQDPRFIELVIKYIESQENDIELFQMVYGQGLGTNCSFFYKAWADALDRNLDVKRADQVYQLGISNNAQPLEPLQNAHSQFQMSVGRRMVKGELPCAEKQVSAETSERQRQVLGKLKKATSVRNSSTAPGKLAFTSSNSSNKKGPQFAVFNEENENLFGSSSGHSLNMINSDSTHKENKMKAGTWNQGMKSLTRSAPPITPVPSTPSFKVCMDEDEAPISSGKPTPLSSKALKIRKAEIHQDPLTLFKSPHPGGKGSLPKFELYAGGKEFSFEEIRWAHYLKRHENDALMTPSAIRTRCLQFTPHKSTTTPQCLTPLPMMSPSDCFVTLLQKAPRPVVKPFCMPLPEENETETEEE